MKAKKIFICFCFLIIILLPHRTHAEVGIKLGWFKPSQPDGYGNEIWKTAKTVGGDTSGILGSPEGGWAFLLIYGGKRWDNGFGIDINTQSPINVDVQVNTVGLNADYKRFVWPVISVSARYNFSYKKKISPYIGGGVGSVFVHTDAEFEDSMGSRHASSSDFLTAMHVFTGLELFSNKTTHVDIEIRYEITTDATKSDPVLHDGVDLGGYLFSIGVSW